MRFQLSCLALMMGSALGTTFFGCWGAVNEEEFYLDQECRQMANGGLKQAHALWAQVSEADPDQPSITVSFFKQPGCIDDAVKVEFPKLPSNTSCVDVRVVGNLVWGSLQVVQWQPTTCFPSYPCNVNIHTDPCFDSTADPADCKDVGGNPCTWNADQKMCLSACGQLSAAACMSQAGCQAYPPCHDLAPPKLPKPTPTPPAPIVSPPTPNPAPKGGAPKAGAPPPGSQPIHASPSTGRAAPGGDSSLDSVQVMLLLIGIFAIGMGGAALAYYYMSSRRERLTMYDSV